MFTHKFSFMSSLGQQQLAGAAAAKPADRNLFRRGSLRRDIIMLAEMMFFFSHLISKSALAPTDSCIEESASVARPWARVCALYEN